MPEKIALARLYEDELKDALAPFGQPAFRVKQVFGWLHKGAGFDEMANLPRTFREQLKETFLDRPLQKIDCKVSKIDRTAKYLFALSDGHCVEAVRMHYHHGVTLCISTQVGCRMGCAFCASTLGGCIRNLRADEMLGEVYAVNRDLADERISNIVLMGSGEPMDNYDEVIRFLRLVNHQGGANIGLRHISVSTCGLVPQMLRFADEGLPVTLSLSLHAPDDAIRREIMPVARRYALDEVLHACDVYVERTGRRVIMEYALIDGVNSSLDIALQLAKKLRGRICHVNLIPLNDVPERNLRGVTRAQATAFLNVLTDNGISATIRREMGDDIDGACGQLRRWYLKEQEEGNQSCTQS